MNTVDFLNPSFFEYFLLVIGVSLIIFVFFMSGVVVHAQHGKLTSIVDDIRAHDPVATVHFDEYGQATVEQHKTPEDIRQEIADEYGLTIDQVQFKIDS